MLITIYKADICPSTQAVLMLAEFLNLNCQAISIDLTKEECNKSVFIEKNLLHDVPLLQDGDFILTEGHAIMTYLVSKYGADLRAELYPSDLTLRAIIDQRLFFDASVLLSNCKSILKAIVNNNTTSPTESQIVEAKKGYDVLEKYLGVTRFVACDYLTVADVAIVATVSAMIELIPLDNHTKLQAWLEILKDQEWYQRVKQFDDITNAEKNCT